MGASFLSAGRSLLVEGKEGVFLVWLPVGQGNLIAVAETLQGVGRASHFHSDVGTAQRNLSLLQIYDCLLDCLGGDRISI